jgi:hypothetical protein
MASNSAALKMLYPTQPIHQCHTRSNNPFTIFEEDKEPDEPSATTNAMTPGQLQLQATIPPYDPFVQEMLDHLQHATRAIHDLRPQCRASPTTNPTTRLNPTVLPQSKPTQTFTPTIIPNSKPTKNTTLPADPALQRTSNPITTSVMITAIHGQIPCPSHVMPFDSCLIAAWPIFPFRHSTT